MIALGFGRGKCKAHTSGLSDLDFAIQYSLDKNFLDRHIITSVKGEVLCLLDKLGFECISLENIKTIESIQDQELLTSKITPCFDVLKTKIEEKGFQFDGVLQIIDYTTDRNYLVGFTSLLGDFSFWVNLNNKKITMNICNKIEVIPGMTGKGIGDLFLDFMKNIGIAFSAEEIKIIYLNEYSVPLLSRNGFQISGKEGKEIGILAL